jgi:hypothetical protein
MTDPTVNRGPIPLPTPPRRRRHAPPPRERPLGKYAAQTTVPVDRSKAEVERVLNRYGAIETGILTKSKEREVVLHFKVNKRTVNWPMALPPKTGFRTEAAYEQEVRRLHRVLVITVKAMLEAVEAKTTTFDKAFLVHGGRGHGPDGGGAGHSEVGHGPPAGAGGGEPRAVRMRHPTTLDDPPRKGAACCTRPCKRPMPRRPRGSWTGPRRCVPGRSRSWWRS